MRITLILLLVLYAVKAHGAESYVLFLDINNSPAEIKAAREAAVKSGRKLLLLPDISEKDRKAYSQMSAQVNALMKLYEKACDNDESSCDEKRKKYEEADQKKSKLLEGFVITPEKLTEFLAAHQEKSVSSVVVSGHDGTGSFSGEFGSIGDAQLALALEKHPALKDSVRTLHLWGCYTTSPGSLLLNWKKHFPNISLITGYEGRAPLNDKPAGWHYLKGVLAQEPALLKAGDSNKLQRLLKKIPGANQVTAAIYSCGDYATTKEHYNLSDLQHRCEDVKPLIQEKGTEFECYLKGSEEKCANPPEDIARGSVRQFYEILHKAAACGAINPDLIFRTYSRDSAIRLVFGREVQKNFEKIYAQKLTEIDEILEKMGAPERIRFKNVGSLSRREMLQRADELHAFLNKQKHDPLADPATFKITERDAQVASLRNFQHNLTGVMGQLVEHCVPFNWTEPNQKEKSNCINDGLIGKEGVKLFLNPENGLRSSLLSEMYYQLSTETDALRNSAGKKPDAATQAKLEGLAAQVEKLNHYARHKENGVPPELLERISQREKYVKLAHTLAERGVRQLNSDPEAMKLVTKINRSNVDIAAKSYEEDLKGQEESLKSIENLSDEDRRIYENGIARTKSRLQNEWAALEAEKIVLSEGEWSDQKAALLNELEDGIGRRLRDQEIESNSSEAKTYREYLRSEDLSESSAERYRNLLKAAEAGISEAKSESVAETRRRGYQFLFTIR